MSANSKGEKPTAAPPDRDHLEKLLDQALADSFPASDPVAIDFESPAVGGASEAKHETRHHRPAHQPRHCHAEQR